MNTKQKKKNDAELSMDRKTLRDIIFVSFAVLGWVASLFAAYTWESGPLMVAVLVFGLGVVGVMPAEVQTFTARALGVIGFSAALGMIFLVTVWLIAEGGMTLLILIVSTLGLGIVKLQQSKTE